MLDLGELRGAVAAHGTVARVVIAQVSGSAPREVGAAMLVWPGGQSGTIGGGALEYEAAELAFARNGATRHALGPNLGQCCGGAVTLWTEQFTAETLPSDDTPYARGPGEMPLSVHRLLAQARSQGTKITSQMVDGWMVEPVRAAKTPLWIWGAGHVGRALVHVLDPLGEFDLTWVDTDRSRFPEAIPAGITALPTPAPDRLALHAPKEAMNLILTYSHEMDLRLCDALLHRGFGFAGLIGSDTKWTRFRSRLGKLGHTSGMIDRICCPIGQKSLGKSPAAIAIGVAAQVMSENNKKDRDQWETPFSASRA